jgi:hypothetical protein
MPPDRPTTGRGRRVRSAVHYRDRVPSSAPQPSTITGTLRHLPTLCRELVVVARDHRLLVERVNRDEAAVADALVRLANVEDIVRGLGESVDRMHRTLVESDPAMALDIVTAVRDDVRSLLVTVAEQANVARDELSAPTT